MWCASCNQEVPAIASNSKDRSDSFTVCARCGSKLDPSTTKNSLFRIDEGHATTTAQSATAEPLPGRGAEMAKPDEHQDTLDANSGFESLHGISLDSELDYGDAGPTDDLMQARVAVNSYRVADINEHTVVERSPTEIRRTDPPIHAQTQHAPFTANPKKRLISSTTIFFGVLLLSFGGALASWSALSGRTALWQIALPAFLLGQGVLLLGMMYQLERILAENRRTQKTVVQLQKVTSQLSQNPSVREPTTF